MKVENMYFPTSIYSQKSSAKLLSEIKKTETSEAVVFDKERRDNPQEGHHADDEQFNHEDIEHHDVDDDSEKPARVVAAGLDITV